MGSPPATRWPVRTQPGRLKHVAHSDLQLRYLPCCLGVGQLATALYPDGLPGDLNGRPATERQYQRGEALSQQPFLLTTNPPEQ